MNSIISVTPACVRRRLASMLYEGLLLLGVLSVTFMLPHLALGMLFGVVLPGPALITHVFIVMGFYFIGYWQHGGQTLAMQTWQLRIIGVAGNPPRLKQLLLRYCLSWPSLLLYGFGLIWAIFDRERLFLHERLSGTRIIFAPPTTANHPPPIET